MKNDPIKLRTIFMGSGEFAVRILDDLLSNQYNIIAVYTQPDKKPGRKKEVELSEIKLLAEKQKIPVHQPESFDETEIEKIRNLKPDILIVASYGKIIPQSVLDLAGFGAINVHPSLLPKFRGPSPIQNVLLCGEKETGTSIMLMNAGVDTGDILAQEKTAIQNNEIYPELRKRLADQSAALLLKTLPAFIDGHIEPQPQDNSQATLCQLIERADGKTNWTESAQDIYNRFRALYPWPGIFTYWERDNHNLRLKLNKISLLRNNPENKHHLGEVFAISDKIGVQTLEGIILLEEVQLEGRKNLPILDFINGDPNFIGSVLK